MIAVIVIIAIIGGILQSTIGFGNAIVLMTVLPYYFPISSAAAVSSLICSSQNAIMTVKYRRYVNYRAIIGPALCFIVGNTLAAFYLTGFDSQLIKMIFGFFLIALAVFFWFFNSRIHLKANLGTMFACGFVSGICEALFSIGGPLMVLFFLAITKDQNEYLGTTQAYFILVGIYSNVLRLIRGVITVQILPYVLLGIGGMLIGMFVGSRLLDKLNKDLLRRLTYIMIAVSGLITVINTLK